MARIYVLLSVVGLMAIPASFVIGFRYDAAAPPINYLWNLALYVAFMAVHIIMLLPGFKKAVYGQPHSTSLERRIYVTVSIVTWILVYAYHFPVPGPAFVAPAWLQFIGVCAVFAGFLMFFEGATFGFLKAFMGTPGTTLSHSADGTTPLMTEGSYASVRHPMYRGAVTYSFASLLIHPHAAQLLFAAMFALSFILFVPFEEKALLRSRGDEYRTYMTVVRYRVFRGVW
jgi:protein-S-isoprenylcysteine O-methyltransferase Ste14